MHQNTLGVMVRDNNGVSRRLATPGAVVDITAPSTSGVVDITAPAPLDGPVYIKIQACFYYQFSLLISCYPGGQYDRPIKEVTRLSRGQGARQTEKKIAWRAFVIYF